MGWMAPLRHRGAKLVFLENHQEREPSMSEITTNGLDLAKHVFQVHGIDAQGTTVLRKRLRRGQVLAFFSVIGDRTRLSLIPRQQVEASTRPEISAERSNF
jgi:hypothetical protein